MRWYNAEAPAQWVMAQAAGRGKLADLHPSPDYIGGFIQFAKRGCAALSSAERALPTFQRLITGGGSAALARKATDGFAEVLTGGGWRRSQLKRARSSGPGCMNYDLDMPPTSRK